MFRRQISREPHGWSKKLESLGNEEPEAMALTALWSYIGTPRRTMLLSTLQLADGTRIIVCVS